LSIGVITHRDVCGRGAMPYEAGNLVLTSVLVIIPRDELAKLLCTVLVKMGN